MGLWDSIADWFQKEEKYTYDEAQMNAAVDKLNKELLRREQKAEDERRKKEKENMLNALPDLDKPNYIGVPNFDEKQAKDDAKNSIADDYDLDKKQQDKYYSDKKSELEAQKGKNSAAAEDNLENARDKAADEKDKFKNKAIRNGIANSTIVGSVNEEVSDELAKQSKYINDKYDEANQAVEDKEAALEGNAALEDESLSKEYTDKYSSEYGKIKDKFDSNKEKIEKKNAQTKKEYESASKKLEADRLEYRKKQQDEYNEMLDKEIYEGVKGERKKDYDERMNIAFEFYSQFPTQTAEDLIGKNRELQELLGANYKKLITKIRNK